MSAHRHLQPVPDAPSDAADPGPLNTKERLQTAIFEAARDTRGRTLEEILDRLRSAFARNGVKAPPMTWLEGVASSAVYGEPYIVDLPSAIAADEHVPAPNEEVRESLKDRRELRAEKAPPGTFPAAADWNLPGTPKTTKAGLLNGPRPVPAWLIVGAIGAAALVTGVWSAARRRGGKALVEQAQGKRGAWG